MDSDQGFKALAGDIPVQILVPVPVLVLEILTTKIKVFRTVRMTQYRVNIALFYFRAGIPVLVKTRVADTDLDPNITLNILVSRFVFRIGIMFFLYFNGGNCEHSQCT